MDDRPTEGAGGPLARIVEAATRPARLALLLDDRQPERLRVEALTMPPERLCWTLTQLDDGLPLDVCQALVHAARLSRGESPGRDPDGRERWAAELAAAVARAWARRRLATLPAAAEFAREVATGPVGAPLPADADPAAAPTMAWLELPPLVGPPPGAEDPSLAARLHRRLLNLVAVRRRDGPGAARPS